MIILHVIVALASIVLASYSLFKPSRRLLLIDWALIAATIISGGVLIALEPSQMLHACVAGLAYVAVASTLTLIAGLRYKAHGKQKVTL